MDILQKESVNGNVFDLFLVKIELLLEPWNIRLKNLVIQKDL